MQSWIRRIATSEVTVGLRERLLAVGLGVTIFALGVVDPLDSSFWLDEIGTVSIIHGDLLEVLDRSHRFLQGSPLYYVIAWLFRSGFGTSEIALRMPSALAIPAAALGLWRLGRRTFDESVGLIAGVIFITLPRVAYAAADARPYALATAALVFSTLFLCRWLDEGRRRDSIVYVLLAAATAYLNYSVALALLAHPVYLLFRTKGKERLIATKDLCLTGLLLVLLLLPLIPTLIRLVDLRHLLVTPWSQSARSILHDLFPDPLLLTLGAGGAIGAIFMLRSSRKPPPLAGSSLGLVFAWLIAPFLFVLVLGTAGGTVLLLPRYFFSVTPAIALMVAVAICALFSMVGRWVCVTAGVLSFVVLWPSPLDHGREPWRAAAARERTVAESTTPVLLFAGFIEAKQADWLTRPITADRLNAPATAYRFEGRVFPAPWDITPETHAYLRGVAKRELVGSDRFLLMTRSADVTKRWLDTHVAPRGFEVTQTYIWGFEIFLYVYDRTR